jgi:hypothetical protein
MAVLTGTAVPLDDFRATRAFRGRETIRLEGERGWVELSGGELREGQVADYQVRYLTSWRGRGRPVPEEIEVRSGSLSAHLSVEGPDINVPLPSDVFELAVPPGAVAVELERVEGEAVFVRANQ